MNGPDVQAKGAAPDFAALEAARFQAMIARDLPRLDALLDAALCYTHSLGEREGKASYLQRLAAGYFDYHSIDHQIERVIEHGASATVIGAMQAKALVGGTARVLDNAYLAVWTRDGTGAAAMGAPQAQGEWRLIAFQPTPILRQP